MSQNKPLVLDVDGTLLRTTLSYEVFWSALGRAPLATMGAVLAHLRNPPALKRALARIGPIRTDLLPVNPQVAGIAEAALEGGSELVLCSSSDSGPLAQLAEENGLTSPVFASDGENTLTGKAKAAALVAAYGRDGFHFGGARPADRAVWQAADGCILVGPARGLAEDLKQEGKEVSEVATGWRALDLIRALRPHRWLKNLLLFLPLLAAHVFSLPIWGTVALGFLVFAAAASAGYLVNDLTDLEADRLHASKAKRPFAAGRLSLLFGMRVALLLVVIALGGAAALGWPFFAVTTAYLVLSFAYSLGLKRLRWVDLFTLASLDSLRVVAGAAVAGIDLSLYFLVGLFPISVLLAALRRLAELSEANEDEPLPGRGYGRKDREDLRNFACLGGIAALGIFLAYSLSDQAALRYPLGWPLWLALLPLALWLLRMVRWGWRAEKEADPALSALGDPLGLALLLLTLGLIFHAAGIWQGLFGL